MNHGFKLHDFIAIMPDNSSEIIPVPILQKPDGELYCIGLMEDELFIDYIADDARVYAENTNYTVCLLPNPSIDIIRTFYPEKNTHSINAFKYAVYRYLQETDMPLYCYTSDTYLDSGIVSKEIVYNDEELVVSYSDPQCSFLVINDDGESPPKRIMISKDTFRYDFLNERLERMNVIPNPQIHTDFYNQYPHLLPQALECHIGYKEML